MSALAQADIVVKRRSLLEIAPDGFFFEAIANGFDTKGPKDGSIYDGRFHDLYYFWDFGDAYEYSAPKNLPAVHRNAGLAYGATASHTYRKAGRYEVSVLVVEPGSGKQARAALNVTVGDPDAFFRGISTIFVDTTGAGKAAPRGARIVPSFDAAMQVVQGNDRSPKRIMLERGQSLAFSGAALGLNPGQNWPSCHIVAAPGSRAKPTVAVTGGFFWNDRVTSGTGQDKDFIFQNIDFIGGWDSTTETGQQVSLFDMFANAPNLHLIDSCSFDGFALPINANGTDPNVDHRVTIVNDTVITNWKEYGFANSNHTATALTGCSFRQHRDALAGHASKEGHNNQGPYRGGGADRNTLVHSCEFYSNNGWSMMADYQAIQPCLRFNTQGHEGAKVNCQANSFEGGLEIVVFGVEEGATARAMNATFEKNYVLGTYQTSTLLASSMGGLTVRNNIMVKPNAPVLQGANDPLAFVGLHKSQGDSLNWATPVSVYNNTFVNLMSNANYFYEPRPMEEVSGRDVFTGLTVANNIVHQPDVVGGQTADGPLQSAPSLWEPREKGYRAAGMPLVKKTATPMTTVASFAPRQGSGALGDALRDPKAYDDFYGQPRPAYPSRGAQETS